jgi:hypothetical protein
MVGVDRAKELLVFPMKTAFLRGGKVHAAVQEAIGNSRFSPLTTTNFPSENTTHIIDASRIFPLKTAKRTSRITRDRARRTITLRRFVDAFSL